MMTPTPAAPIAFAYDGPCRLYVDGEWRDGRGGTATLVSPADQSPLAEVAVASADDVHDAVSSARRAYEGGPWSRLSARDRGRLLIRVAALVEQQAERFARTESANVGKPIRESREIDVHLAIDAFEYYAGLATKVAGETLPIPGDRLALTLREPLGVVGAITPFNFPLLMAAWKIAPALACGNAVVIKPSPETPLTTLLLTEAIREAGVPDGVVNLILGGAEPGGALVAHPDVDKIAFTGSTEVGKRIAADATGTLKRVSLELGGKAPNVVLDDADLDQAVAGALFGIFWNQGEICTAGSRVLVHERVHDDFVARFVARAEQLRVGHPLDESTQVGPLVSKRQQDKVQAYLARAERDGLDVRCGGAAPFDDERAQGNYVRPTIIDRVPEDQPLACEEIFGPVAAIIPFHDDADAIRIANDTVYGLTAGVWSRDAKRLLRMCRAIRAGTVWGNTYNVVTSEAPFGGFKESGLGREMGTHVIDLYTEVKTIMLELSEHPADWFGGGT